ncbi:type II toxin-antitoxin system RelE/ParE family toxin [Lapidilactobacillus salsurivasis]
MKKVHFDYYVGSNGKSEFLDYINNLPIKDRVKLLTTIQTVETVGIATASRMEYVKKIDDNLFELRSKVGSNIQRALYFHVHNGNYLITHGFTKKTNKTPKREIEHAKRVRLEWQTTDGGAHFD